MCTDWSCTIMATFNPILPVVYSQKVITLHLFILGNVVDSVHRISSC